jgi:YggT family protein
MSLDSRILRFLIKITEPILAPFRRMIPPVLMFDISPIIVLLIIWFLQKAVAAVLLSR